MGDGVKTEIQGADEVIAKFLRMTDLTQNLAPLWPTILGDEGSSDPLTLRGGEKYNFEAEVGPERQSWPELSKGYKEWKDKNFSPDLTKLFLTGTLYDSLVNVTEHSVLAQGPMSLIYGTDVPYGAAQHFGYAPRNLPPRPYIGQTEGQKEWTKITIRDYFIKAFALGGE